MYCNVLPLYFSKIFKRSSGSVPGLDGLTDVEEPGQAGLPEAADHAVGGGGGTAQPRRHRPAVQYSRVVGNTVSGEYGLPAGVVGTAGPGHRGQGGAGHQDHSVE